MTMTNASIDMTDVPFVSARELSVAVKLLTLHGASLETAHTLSDAARRNVFTAYWNLVSRDGPRKTATLVRLQHLINVCAARRMQSLLSSHGRTAIAEAVTAAAACRLNASYGLNPLKIAQAIECGVQGQFQARQNMASAA